MNTFRITLFAVGLGLILFAVMYYCDKSIGKQKIDVQQSRKTHSEMTCSEVEDAYAKCDSEFSISHRRDCRESFFPSLLRCYGNKVFLLQGK